MAKVKMYSPFDSKLQMWMQPMFFLHAGQAERQWRELANDPSTIVAKHPVDFILYQVGEFDDETGAVSPVHPPVQLMTALAAKNKPTEELALKNVK